MATRTSRPWVLDTSVAVAWFLPVEVQHERALIVRRDVRDNAHLYVVPTLFYSELIHVLARAWGGAVWVRAGVESVMRFGIRMLPISEQAWMRTADWASEGLGGYDATFVALAEDLGGRWLTADKQAARIAKDRALPLDEWEPGSRP